MSGESGGAPGTSEEPEPQVAGAASGAAAEPGTTTAAGPAEPLPPGWPPGWPAPRWGSAPVALQPYPTPATTVQPLPPPRPQRPLFGENWPGPKEGPSRRMVGAAAVAGIAAAVAIPAGPPGIGWLVAAAVTMLAVVLACGRAWPGRFPAYDIAWAVAALGLVAVSTARDAPWLAVLCLLAAGVAGSFAVAGGAFGSVAGGAFAVPLAAVRGLPWLGRRLRADAGSAGRRHLRLGVSALVGVAVVAIFAPLLTSADAAFARVVEGMLPDVDVPSFVRWVALFVLGGAGAIGACFLLAAPPGRGPVPQPRPSRLRGLEWALPIGLLTGLFGLFVAVQLTTLFGSDDHVQRTTGLTYAEYARSGFWELLAVTVLALGVIVAGMRFGPEQTSAARAAKRGLLAALAVLTLVIVASALSRMWLYQQAYGFTVLRLLVLTCELWLGFGFLLVLTAVLRLRPAGLARGMAAAAAAALLGLAVLNPEGFIAEHNVARFTADKQIDTDYLGRLSADAVPGLADLQEPMRSCVLASIAARQPVGTDWRSWNTARSEAAAVFAAAPPTCR